MAVKSDRLSNIGKIIKETRTEKKMSLQDVATKSSITSSLLSKIENFKTVPSIPVLFHIAEALEVDMSELVKNVNAKEFSFIHIKKDELQGYDKEDSKGLMFYDLMTYPFKHVNMRANIVKVSPNTNHEPFTANGMELIFNLSGKLTYRMGENEIYINEGDTLFFDGNTPHSLQNFDTLKDALLFKVSFMNPNS
ncbi:helix-turn-helix domain-containing protein [Aureibacter tunicatorum]|uniref:Transcriptional regulator with XRE-family HTH domain n=1 Tax=Aureibacter tunicatorum TaxID=866807 RepID=A0AAE3XGW1_9BACT|nr:XRE family transcriptional regulator [Aureibacter tunicatorum]MDR6237381.1 transcriptional regulator with XRE-family HTH domain [Aureibacter tunicatorum]BDD06371.1 XRE family transcriptional regulator [Aureibacter tunicatorum]